MHTFACAVYCAKNLSIKQERHIVFLKSIPDLSIVFLIEGAAAPFAPRGRHLCRYPRFIPNAVDVKNKLDIVLGRLRDKISARIEHDPRGFPRQ